MANVKVLLAGLYFSSAFASPGNRNPKRGGGWGEHDDHTTRGGGWIWGKKTTGENGRPWGYGTTSSEDGGWGYGSATACVASTVTETQAASTVTLSGSTVYITGHETTVTLPGTTYTAVSTVTEAASCSITAKSYITRTAAGYNNTPTETSIITAPGTTVTAYR